MSSGYPFAASDSQDHAGRLSARRTSNCASSDARCCPMPASTRATVTEAPQGRRWALVKSRRVASRRGAPFPRGCSEQPRPTHVGWPLIGCLRFPRTARTRAAADHARQQTGRLRPLGRARRWRRSSRGRWAHHRCFDLVLLGMGPRRPHRVAVPGQPRGSPRPRATWSRTRSTRRWRRDQTTRITLTRPRRSTRRATCASSSPARTRRRWSRRPRGPATWPDTHRSRAKGADVEWSSMNAAAREARMILAGRLGGTKSLWRCTAARPVGPRARLPAAPSYPSLEAIIAYSCAAGADRGACFGVAARSSVTREDHEPPVDDRRKTRCRAARRRAGRCSTISRRPRSAPSCCHKPRSPCCRTGARPRTARSR